MSRSSGPSILAPSALPRVCPCRMKRRSAEARRSCLHELILKLTYSHHFFPARGPLPSLRRHAVQLSAHAAAAPPLGLPGSVPSLTLLSPSTLLGIGTRQQISTNALQAVEPSLDFSFPLEMNMSAATVRRPRLLGTTA